MNTIKSQTYYHRKVDNVIISFIKENYSWLIDYVKSHKELDFQTGEKKFSIYRGTSRILSIEKSRGNKCKFTAANSYQKLADSSFFERPTKKLFDEYLQSINNTGDFDKWYADNNHTECKEGYYQTLIGRRYTFEAQASDDFVIIDKEFVVGFKDRATKEDWNHKIEENLLKDIDKVRKTFTGGALPRKIKSSYGEFDFLGLNKNGDIIIMELKQNDGQKTYLSPIQTKYYYEQLSKIIDEQYEMINTAIKDMVSQKIEIGIIKNIFGDRIPDLSKKIECWLVVGEENFSKEIIRRYAFFRDNVLPELIAFKCYSKTNGELISTSQLSHKLL